MNILITGFMPFGGDDRNPSFDCLRQFPEETGNAHVTVLELPVTFRQAPKILLGTLEELKPEGVICLGLAASRKKVTPELVAVNLAHARIPDNEGAQPLEQPLIPGGPDGIFSTLPVFELVRRLEQAGIPAELSCTAGTYVCNSLFYHLMTWAKPRRVPAGFVHVPNTDTLALDEIRRAVLIMADCISGKTQDF